MSNSNDSDSAIDDGDKDFADWSDELTGFYTIDYEINGHDWGGVVTIMPDGAIFGGDSGCMFSGRLEPKGGGVRHAKIINEQHHLSPNFEPIFPIGVLCSVELNLDDGGLLIKRIDIGAAEEKPMRLVRAKLAF